MLPLAAKEVFRLRSVGEAFDGAVGHLELTPDGTRGCGRLPATRGPWRAGLERGWRTARSAMESPPSPRAALVHRPSPRRRGPGREGTGGGGRQPAQRPPRGCATDASGRRPASPGVPRLWRPPRRTVRDPGRRSRCRVASRAMRPGWTPPGQAADPPADGTRRRRAPCRRPVLCVWRTHRHQPPAGLGHPARAKLPTAATPHCG